MFLQYSTLTYVEVLQEFELFHEFSPGDVQNLSIDYLRLN